MKIDTLLKFKEPLDKFRDIETKLLSRNAKGKIAGWGALLSAVVQVVILLLQDDLIGKVIGLFSEPLQLNLRIFIPGILTILALIIYFLIRRTGFLMKETKEPFRYTFWVESFNRVDSTPADRFTLKAEDRLKMMHHDLIELIHHRIKRFSILEEGSEEPEKRMTDTRLSSHIHIHGSYAIREDRENNEWIIHVMPYIRIGQKGSAETLAQSIRFPLLDESPDVLDTEEYNQLLERVYSRITTEIYARIEQDIEKKINLFPTSYLQSNALYIEAHDMAASNTINAFDSAIKLYQSAIRKIELTFSYSATGFFLRIPVLRGLFTKYLYQYARIQIGHAQCLIYKNRIAVLSGRKSNPLFEIKQNLKKTIIRLEKYHLRLNNAKSLQLFRNDRKTFSILSFLSFPKDSVLRGFLLKPKTKTFNETCNILFHAYIVESLTDSLTGSYRSAGKYLEKARAVAPDLSTSHVLFFLAEAYCESDIDKALMIFQHAAEIDPSFQIARYDLAFWMEMKFRANAEITPERAKSVLQEYDRVLQINPGNIAALTAQGNLLWLTNDLKKALRKFNEGCNLKAIVSETFIAQLLYGKARVLAEEGKPDESIELFAQAIANNPNVGAYSMNNEKGITVTYYDYISKNLVERYRKYQRSVADQKSSSASLLEKLRSFANNDLANACMNYYIRFGDSKMLSEAIQLYEEAIQLNPFNSVALYNKSNALTFSSDPSDISESMSLLQRVTGINPRWLEALTSSIELIQQESFRKIKDTRTDIASLEARLSELSQNEEPFTTSVETSLFRNQTAGTGKVPELRSPESLLKLQSSQLEKQRISESLNHLKKEKSIQISRLAGLKPLLRRVFETSKLISLYDGLALESFNSESIQTLLNLKIDWVRLDIEDVRALRNYAISYYYYLLVHENDGPATLTDAAKKDSHLLENREICLKLFQHLSQYYYEEDFFMVRLMQDLMQDMQEFSQLYKVLFINRISRKSRKLLKSKHLAGEIRACFLDKSYQIHEYELHRDPSHNRAWNLSIDAQGEKHSFYLRLKGRTLEVMQPEIEKFGEIINGSIRFWIGEDPVHWNYLNWAERYLNSEEYTYLLEQASRLSFNPVLSFILADRYFEQEDYQQAVNCYLQVIECDQSVPLYHYKTGLSYSKLQDMVQAIHYFTNAVVKRRKFDTDTNSLYFYYNELLTAYIALDDPETFIRFLKKSKDLHDQPEQLALLFNKVGNALSGKEKWTEARSCYRNATEWDADQPIYLSNQALMYVNEGDFEHAADLYVKAINLRRKQMNDAYSLDYYYSQYAKVFYKTGHSDDFFLFVDQSGDFSSLNLVKAEFYNTIGVLYSNDTLYVEAMPYFEQANRLNPDKVIFLSNLALMYSNNKEWTESVKLFKEVLSMVERQNPAALEADYYYSLAADAFYYDQTFDEFLDMVAASASLGNHPDKKALVMNRAGNLFAVETDLQMKAVQFYEQAIALDPKLPIFYCNLGYVFSGLKNWEKAWYYYKEAIEKRRLYPDPNYTMEYYFGLAVESCFMADQLESFLSSDEMLGDTQISKSYKGVIFNQIGNLYSGQSHHNQAVTFYRKAIELDSNVPIYHNNLGLMFQTLENWQEAIDCFLKAVELRITDPDDGYSLEYYFKQGVTAFYKAGRIAEFLDMFETTADFVSNPTSKAVIYNITGNLYHGSGDTHTALEYYHKACNADPAGPIYQSNIGVMQAILQNWLKAAESQEEAVRLAQDQQADEADMVYYIKLLGEAYGQLNKMNILKDRITYLNLSAEARTKILSDLGIYFTEEGLTTQADSCATLLKEWDLKP